MHSLRCLNINACSLGEISAGLEQLTKLGFGPGSDGGQTISLEPLQGATNLRCLTLHGYVEEEEEVVDSSTLEHAEVLEGLTALTNWQLTCKLTLEGIKEPVLPPEGAYLSRLRSLEINGNDGFVAKASWLLAAQQAGCGFTAGTNYTYIGLLLQLSSDTSASELGLDALWQPLSELLHCWLLLQEMMAFEASNVESKCISMLVGDLLENMGG
ncbi:hypothetical protein ABPG75_007758 [Micractinium tetrahymenae]